MSRPARHTLVALLALSALPTRQASASLSREPVASLSATNSSAQDAADQALSLRPAVLLRGMTRRPKSHLGDHGALFQKAEAFSYVRNNPVSFVDPTGLDAEFLVGGPYSDYEGQEHSFGHVALRVHGDGYDKVYDFGRYGRVGGTFNESGEGVLRVWTSSVDYIAGEDATGRATTGYNFKTTPEQDAKMMGHFARMAEGISGDADPRGRPFTRYILEEKYHALRNNCTTVSIEGFAASGTGIELNDQRQIQGRGLGFVERMAAKAAGWPEKMFMPFDLQGRLETLKVDSKRSINGR